jgi:nucleoside-diphosphate-sugar epimerase
MTDHPGDDRMRVLVAGATSVPGLPLLRELHAAGHEVVGLTRSAARTAQIAETGAMPVVADVFDAEQIEAVVADAAPEAVVSLLTTLPKRGPMRLKDFDAAATLWSRGVPNLVNAAQRAGARRIVAESVIFAYGYAPSGPPLLDESDPYPAPPPRGGAAMLAALRGMEQTVLNSGRDSATEGIVLRYGAFYGAGVPHIELMKRLATWWALPVPAGNGVVSWIELGDLVRATVASLEHGRGGQIYNIVDDQPVSFGDFARDLASTLHRPRPLTLPRWVFRPFASYFATAFGNTWLPVSNAKAKAKLGWAPRVTQSVTRSR